jgi:hypothetical protein
MKRNGRILACAFCVGVLACHKQPEPIPRETTEAAPVAAESAHPAADPHAGLGLGTAVPKSAPASDDTLSYDAPKTWVSAPNPNPMRTATFKIPKAKGETDDAELAISAAAGGVEANIKRWEQQFGDAKAKTESRTVHDLKVTLVELKGTFSSGGMMGQPAAPKTGQMLLGAIVDLGDRQHFFKLTGSEKTLTLARKDFEAFVGTFRRK